MDVSRGERAEDSQQSARPAVAEPPARESSRLACWLLVAVAAGFFVYQLIAIGLRYPLTSDEAIYLSQFNPDLPSYEWAAWRAWGMPVLGAPIAVMNAPLTVLRLYFAALSSVGLFLAYQPWLRVTRRPLAPMAALLFAGGTAAVVYNGTLALPNYYSALAAVGATGYFLVSRNPSSGGSSRGPLVGLAVSVALAALVRPSDSLWLVMPLGVAWLVLKPWRRLAVFAAIAIGEIAGWSAWIIEAFARFGGPLSRLQLSSDMLGGTHLYPDLGLVRLYLKLWSTGQMGAVSLDVPARLRGGAATIATVHLPSIGTAGLLWWTAAILALAAGLVGAWRARRTDGIVFLMPLAVGLSVAFPYLFMMRYAQLRFLLPAIGLLVIPLAYGVLAAGGLRGRLPKVLAPVVAVAVTAVLVVTQTTFTPRLHDVVAGADRAESAVVKSLSMAGFDGQCAIAGESVFNIAYQTDCAAIGSIPAASPQEPAGITRARANGDKVAVVLRQTAPAGSFLSTWRVTPIDTGGKTRYLYVPA